MTKSEAKLIQAIIKAKAADRTSLVVEGARQVTAARKLAAQGFGTYTSKSRSVVGESYYNHFTRTWETKRPYAVLEGVFTFAA